MSASDRSDNSESLCCPRCAAPLKSMHTPERLSLYACAPCRGAWLDGGAIADAGWGKGLPDPVTYERAERSCPRCATVMLALHYQVSESALDVDYCEGCSGMWIAREGLEPLRLLATSTHETSPEGGAEPSPEVSEEGQAGTDKSPPEKTLETPIYLSQEPQPRSRMGMTVVAPVLLVAAVAILFWRSGGETPGSESRGRPSASTRRNASRELGSFFTVVPALKKFYRAKERWPHDPRELDAFAKAKSLSFRLSAFAKLSWDPKDNGGLILHYQEAGEASLHAFHVGKPR